MNKFGSTPLQARFNFPYLTAILIIVLIFAFIFLIWMLVQRYLKYLKSEKYLNKEKNRETKKKDLIKIQKEFNLEKQDLTFLSYLTNHIKTINLFYILKDNNSLQEFTRTAFFSLKEQNASAEKINQLFQTSFKIERNIAQTKKMISTKQIAPSTVVFYVTKEGEKLPFYCAKNTNEYLALEIPQFFFEKPNKPTTLDKINFTFKPQNSSNYCFSTRIIRYHKADDEKFYMILAHTENLYAELQRHHKRKTIDYPCDFSPIKININHKTSNDMFIYTNKYYKGKLINISGGGCCIKTSLPIKENQHIGIKIPMLDLNSPIVGLIKKTRRLPDGTFSLHIQFIKFSITEQNKILAFVYGFVL